MALIEPPHLPGTRIIRTPEPSKVIDVTKTLDFYHSGDLGDMIYSLAFIKALGGGRLFLGGDCRFSLRAAFTEESVAWMKPLLDVQPYLKNVAFSASIPSTADYNLNDFRNYWFDRIKRKSAKTNSLYRAYEEHFGVPTLPEGQPWLTVPQQIRCRFPVVINRTARVHNDSFPWEDVAEVYDGRMLFIGYREEYDEWCKRFGKKAEYYQVKDALEAARIIAGSRVFIGNQSGLMAIAQGLGKDLIQEVCDWSPDAVIDLPNAQYFRKAWQQIKLTNYASASVSSQVRKTKDPKISMRGIMYNRSGFGQMVLGLRDSLTKMGIRVSLSSTRKEDFEQYPPVERADVLVEAMDEIKKNLKQDEAVYSMWETTIPSREFIDCVNSLASKLIVPTAWGASTFNAAGINIPIGIVPLGIDPKVYHPIPWPDRPEFVFGIAGRFQQSPPRKGHQDVIDAFLKAFPDDKDVRLELKSPEERPIQVSNDPRIKLVNTYFTDDDMARWYGSLDCYVSGSHCEGWGLHQHQAMAVGRPMIGCRFGAVGEFFDDSVGYPVDFDFVQASGHYKGYGMWSNLKLSSLVYRMRQAYENRDELRRLGRFSAIRAARYTWDRAATIFAREMELIQ